MEGVGEAAEGTSCVTAEVDLAHIVVGNDPCCELQKPVSGSLGIDSTSGGPVSPVRGHDMTNIEGDFAPKQYAILTFGHWAEGCY